MIAAGEVKGGIATPPTGFVVVVKSAPIWTGGDCVLSRTSNWVLPGSPTYTLFNVSPAIAAGVTAILNGSEAAGSVIEVTTVSEPVGSVVKSTTSTPGWLV